MDTVESYRIRELQAAIRVNPEAHHDFLIALKKEGTPIIEEVEGYKRFVWVTHVYLANQPLENVAVYETHLPFNEERATLNPIEGTNLWYKTTIVPYGTRVHYGFSVNDSLRPECEKRVTQLQTDPLNLNPVLEVNGLMLSQATTPVKKE